MTCKLLLLGVNAIQNGDTSWANAVVPVTSQLLEQEQPVRLSCYQVYTGSISANSILDAQVNDWIISKVLSYVKKKQKSSASQLHLEDAEVRLLFRQCYKSELVEDGILRRQTARPSPVMQYLSLPLHISRD